MESEGFRLTISLRTPGIIRPYLALDGVLLEALQRLHGSTEQALAHMPLQRQEGLWQGSCVQFGRGFFTEQRYTSRLTRSDLNPQNYTDQRTRGGRAKVLVRGGPFMAMIDTYPAWIGELSFLGVGDADTCMSLIETLPGLGAKTNTGNGAIANMSWEPEETNALWNSASGEALPLRPIPTQTWERWHGAPAETVPIDQVSWQPPYYCSPRSECVLPRTYL